MNRTLILCLALAGACATGGKAQSGRKPDWVDGASREYPKEMYLTGVGSADDRASAEERARNEIAKVFVVRIRSTTEDTSSESTKTAGDKKAAYTFTQDVSQKIQSLTDKNLSDVNIAQVWQDQASRRFYALAVLDRAKASRGLHEQISDFDAKAQDWVKELDSSSDKLARVKAGMRLATLLKARADLNTDLRIIDPSGSGVPAPFDEASLGPKSAKALAELTIAVDLKAGDDRQVESGIIKGLNGLGLQAKSGASADADVLIEGNVDSAQVEGDGSKLKWVRTNSTLGVKDARTGKIFLRFDASERDAHPDFNEAVRLTRAALAKKVAEKVREGVVAYFEN